MLHGSKVSDHEKIQGLCAVIHVYSPNFSAGPSKSRKSRLPGQHSKALSQVGLVGMGHVGRIRSDTKT